MLKCLFTVVTGIEAQKEETETLRAQLNSHTFEGLLLASGLFLLGTLLVILVVPASKKKGSTSKKIGEAGHRSPYLSHAKRALYHLSYIPSNFFKG